ncbi:hypothetical protein [Oceanisphaera arctica]|uniref:Uncharacterized protein n=1 Tax=Oceanisphaera arctica TaxID=641510 RepID=A0A2P5TQF3_9GAMM|nr:hypothetical protein [Oceanisphaera arctica]PPL17996.1 hypothetical protein UN63_02165 [Oceanisphaera arctica]GHA09062.1 hypothetical protein GCM10007082_07290 [Oceanisphaera arctica]
MAIWQQGTNPAKNKYLIFINPLPLGSLAAASNIDDTFNISVEGLDEIEIPATPTVDCETVDDIVFKINQKLERTE